MQVCPPMSFELGGFYFFERIINMAERPFKSYRSMLKILREKGMDIGKGNEGSRVIKILESENYYNVINGYKDLFIDLSNTSVHGEAYKAGTKFDELYGLYTFDRNLRIVYLKYLVQIENNFKSILSHSFSDKYGHENYLKLENFDTKASTNVKYLKKLAKENKLDCKQIKADHILWGGMMHLLWL